jgi:hypothetical protein
MRHARVRPSGLTLDFRRWFLFKIAAKPTTTHRLMPVGKQARPPFNLRPGTHFHYNAA